MFRLLEGVFDNNAQLSEEGGFIFDWMAENYVDSALMLLRRELDRQNNVENLWNLLHDIIDHHRILTRGRYCTAWGRGGRFDVEMANRSFDLFRPVRVEGNADLDFIDAEVVRADLEQVDADAGRVRRYAERTRAHRTRARAVDTAGITFRELHRAIADVRGVVAKFYTLLTLRSIGRWEPVPQFDTVGPFVRPWVLDRDAVEAAAEEGAGQ